MNAIVYNSLIEYFERERLTESAGDLISTLGFESENDGGAANYIIESTSEAENEDLAFSGDCIICRGFKLRLLPENGVAYVEQFGAKGNLDLSKYSDTDKAEFYAANSNAIQLALNSGLPTVAFADKTYMVSGEITVTKPVNIVGHSAILQLGENSSSVIKTANQGSVLENVYISNLTLKGFSTSYNCVLFSAENVGNLTIDNVKFSTCKVAICISSSDDKSYAIRISNCKTENVIYGFDLINVYDFNIRNCYIGLAETVESIGLTFSEECGYGTIEDLSVIGAGESAIDFHGNSVAWSGLAVERIFFKNLLIADCNYAVRVYGNEIPLCFANTMIVEANYGILLEDAKNISVINSSVLISSPDAAVGDAVPLCIGGFVGAKFSHTQFDFPFDFQSIYSSAGIDSIDISFIDCTMQKTDIAGVDGVTTPSGFGKIGYNDTTIQDVIETFDACEFRSYIQTYSVTTGEGEAAVTNYNFPLTLSTASGSGSKLIIKNCRFVNENACTVPYFKLDDDAKFDNIVVYNCFFENYMYSETSESITTYPLFGKLTDNQLSTAVGEHNIFAKSNMRSSTPVRNTGTTINETVIYE